MALQSLNVQTVAPYIASAWKQHLNTNKDPANGRWYTNGANGDGIGLYGGLSDAVPNGLVFDESALTYLPKQIVAASSIVNNMNGLTPQSTLQLSYTHTDSTTTSHTITNSVQVGVGLDIKGKADFIVVGAEATVKFSLAYTFSYASTTSTTSSEAQTFSQSLPITVPSGRIYKGVLLATVQSIQVPYTATITVKGSSETWFEDRVQGHYNWMCDPGTLFGWISQFGTAGSDSSLYRNLGNGQGGVTVSGVLNSQQTADFQAQVYDITESAKGDLKRATGRSPAASEVGESAVPEGELVESFHLSRQPAHAQG